jgi:hypothetical protein
MKLWFLPYVREGVAPMMAGGVRALATVALRLESAGRSPRDVSHTIALAGPGDVLGIDPRQVLRVSPKPGSRLAEPDFFPLIEFDAPDLPWAYSPLLPTPTRLVPWLRLIVLEANDNVRLERGAQGQSPWILHIPQSSQGELPDLEDSWAWAHAQIACEQSTQIASTLASQPDRTLSRLLAPRRLLANRPYIAAVVPAFKSGRVAGLGENPIGNPAVVTGLEPAWRAGDMPDRLPAYYTWSFRTGEAGDFESLAARMRAVTLDPKAETTLLHLSLPNGDVSQVVEWEAPLRVPGHVPSKPRRPTVAVNEIKKVIKPPANPPVLGPSYFGLPWTADRPLTPATSWAPDLNLTPALRAAAGLGADVVRADQDALVAAAKSQLDAFKQEQREGRRRQFSTAFANRVKRRMAAAPETERARINAPLVSATQQGAANVGAYTVAGRKVARKTWLRAGAPVPTPPVVGGPVATFIPAVVLAPVVARTPATPPPPAPPSDAGAVPTGAFAPRFARPMSEPLSERFPELMLPGLGSIPPDGAAIVESNAAFIEAFLTGANQALAYELLWRGLPSDPKATAFQRFWAHAGNGRDIDDISTWTPDSTAGSHVISATAMILLLRGEIVRRYPTMVVSVVPATWNTDGTRSPAASGMTLPAFRGRIGEDMLYAGFAQLTADAVIGTPKAPGSAGSYFLLSENVSDPRFGLDLAGGTTPPTRATLSWTQLNLPSGAANATLPAFPSVPDASFNPATATAAAMANLVRQRPFRAFLHGSLLLRPVT